MKKYVNRRNIVIAVTILITIIMCFPVMAATTSLSSKSVKATTNNIYILSVKGGTATGWKSTKPKIAKIIYSNNAVAVIKALKKGTAKVTCKSGNIKLSCTYKVKKSGSFPKTLTVLRGDSFKFKYKKKGTWSSSSSKIASVSGKAKSKTIKFKKKGTVKITVKAGSKTIKCTVSVKDLKDYKAMAKKPPNNRTNNKTGSDNSSNPSDNGNNSDNPRDNNSGGNNSDDAGGDNSDGTPTPPTDLNIVTIDGVEFYTKWCTGVDGHYTIYSNNKTALEEMEVRIGTTTYDLGLDKASDPNQILNVVVPDWKNFIAQVIVTKGAGSTGEYARFFNNYKYARCISIYTGLRTGSFPVSYYYKGKLIKQFVVTISSIQDYEKTNINWRKLVNTIEQNAWSSKYFNYKMDEVKSWGEDYPNRVSTLERYQRFLKGIMTDNDRLGLIVEYVSDAYTYSQITCLGGATILAWVWRDLGYLAKYQYAEGCGFGDNSVSGGLGCIAVNNHVETVLFDKNWNRVSQGSCGTQGGSGKYVP